MCHCQNTFWNGNAFARTATNNSVITQNGNGTWVYGGAYQADLYVHFTPISNGSNNQSNSGTCGTCCGCCRRQRCGSCQTQYNGCLLTATDSGNTTACPYANTYGFGRCGTQTRSCGYYNS